MKLLSTCWISLACCCLALPVYSEEEPLKTFHMKLNHSLYTQDTEPLDLTLEKTLAIASKQNLNYLNAQSKAYELKQEEKSAFKLLFPSISLSSTATKQYHNSTKSFSNTFTLSQPLYQGTALYNGWKKAKLSAKQGHNTTAFESKRLMTTVKNTWIDLIKLHEVVQETKNSFNRVKNVLNISNKFYQEGLVPRTDTLNSEVNVAKTRIKLIKATVAYEKQKMNLLNLLNLPLDTPISMEGKLHPLEEDDFILQKLFDIALRNRIDLDTSVLSKESSERSVTIAKNAYLPQASISYIYNQDGDNFYMHQGSYTRETQISLSWNLWEWGKTRNDVRAAKSQLTQASIALQQKKYSILMEVEEAWINFEESKQEVSTLKKTLANSKENYRIYLIQYQEQETTARRVLETQTDLSSIQTEYTQSLANLHKAWKQLEFVVGTPLPISSKSPKKILMTSIKENPN